MGRFFVVGDIHACPQELEALLSGLSLQPEDRVVFLGDYIDRGPGAREVVDVLLGLKAERVCPLTFLKGNHEDMFLDFLGYEGHYGESFLLNGGAATLKSYRISRTTAIREIALFLPPTHLQFFLDLVTFFEAGNTLCVHAGVNPLRPLSDQDGEDLLWIRQEFIANSHTLPYTIVFGHTPQREVLFDLPYKIGIDTGLVYGGKLSCLELVEKKLFQVAKGSRKVHVVDVKDYWKEEAILVRAV